MTKRDIEKLISDLEDARTSVEEVRADNDIADRDARLEEVEETLEIAVDNLEDMSGN